MEVLTEEKTNKDMRGEGRSGMAVYVLFGQSQDRNNVRINLGTIKQTIKIHKTFETGAPVAH